MMEVAVYVEAFADIAPSQRLTARGTFEVVNEDAAQRLARWVVGGSASRA